MRLWMGKERQGSKKKGQKDSNVFWKRYGLSTFSEECARNENSGNRETRTGWSII